MGSRSCSSGPHKGKAIRKRLVVGATSVLIAAFLVSCELRSVRDLLPFLQSTLPSDPSILIAGQEVTIRGKVIENNLGCNLDVACFLRVQTDGHEAVVVYHYGEWPPCPNEGAIRAGAVVDEGDMIEAFGIVEEGGGTISTCESQEYYIRTTK